MENASLGKRAGGMIFALGTQAVLIALFLFSMPRIVSPQVTREMLLSLLPQRVEKPPTVIDARGAPRRTVRSSAQSSTAVVIPSNTVSVPTVPLSPSLQAGGPGLDCVPEKSGSRFTERSSGCPSFKDEKKSDTQQLLGPPSQAKNQTQWDADMVQKNTPTHVPCTDTVTIPLLAGRAMSAVMLDIVCVGKKLVGEETPPPPKVHASEAAFQAALAAANQRRGGRAPVIRAPSGQEQTGH